MWTLRIKCRDCPRYPWHTIGVRVMVEITKCTINQAHSLTAFQTALITDTNRTKNKYLMLYCTTKEMYSYSPFN